MHLRVIAATGVKVPAQVVAVAAVVLVDDWHLVGVVVATRSQGVGGLHDFHGIRHVLPTSRHKVAAVGSVVFDGHVVYQSGQWHLHQPVHHVAEFNVFNPKAGLCDQAEPLLGDVVAPSADFAQHGGGMFYVFVVHIALNRFVFCFTFHFLRIAPRGR